MIDSVSVLSKLGNSDHNMLQWNVQLSPATSLLSHPGLDHARADFSAIRDALMETDWVHILQGNANSQWQTFHSLLKDHVPRKKLSLHQKKKAPWMTYKAVRLINRKQKLFKKYRNGRHPAYAKAARAAAIEIRRAKRSFETKLAMNIDCDRKSFYTYVRSRLSSRTGPGPLVDDQGKTSILPSEMAEKFNSYLASVFTVENTSNMPTADLIFSGSETEKLMEFTTDESVVRKKLELKLVRQEEAATRLSHSRRR